MQWLGWMADQHVWVASFALVAGLLLPFPLLAARRPGRGIRPWWTTCRYLIWMGLIASALSVATGQFLGNKLGFFNGEWILRSEWSDIRFHQYFGGATVFFGFLCIRSAYIRRKEHQGLSKYALLTGLLWAVAAGGAGYYGIKLSRIHKDGSLAANQAQTGNTPIETESQNDLLRILDYPSLVPMHSAPVRSPAHKNRWIRVWVSANAAESYSQGATLPEGTLVVMNSVEDRWGRITYDIGPLYSLEVLPGGEHRLGMHWSYVPEAKRDEVGGLKSVSWTTPNENLTGCLECHADGMASPRSRSRTRVSPPATTQAPRSADAQGEGQQQQPQQQQQQQQQ
jgi:hypothetical protein